MSKIFLFILLVFSLPAFAEDKIELRFSSESWFRIRPIGPGPDIRQGILPKDSIVVIPRESRVSLGQAGAVRLFLNDEDIYGFGPPGSSRRNVLIDEIIQAHKRTLADSVKAENVDPNTAPSSSSTPSQALTEAQPLPSTPPISSPPVTNNAPVVSSVPSSTMPVVSPPIPAPAIIPQATVPQVPTPAAPLAAPAAVRQLPPTPAPPIPAPPLVTQNTQDPRPNLLNNQVRRPVELVRYRVSRSENGIFIELNQDVGVAAIQRGDFLVIAVSGPLKPEFVQLQDLNPVEIPSTLGSAFRLRIKNHVVTRLPEGLWIREGRSTGSLATLALVDTVEGPRVLINSIKSSSTTEIRDPLTGRTLFLGLVPFGTSTITQNRVLPEFELENTLLGVALFPTIDRVKLAFVHDGFYLADR